MKGLLFLSLVGAAIYALLVYTNDALKDSNAEITYAGQAQSTHTVGEHLSSWDAYLPTPAVSQNSQSVTSQPAPSSPQQKDAERQRKPTTSESDGSESKLVAWAKVVLAAQLHSEASVTSPTVRFYGAGTDYKSSDEKVHGFKCWTL